MDSSVHGISQARILEWFAISFPRESPDPGIKPASPALAVGFFTSEPPGKPHHSVNTIKTPMPPECCPISLYVGIEEKISEKGISSCIFKSNYSDEGQS